MICRIHKNCLKCFMLVLVAIDLKFCAYLELDIDIDVVICCVELVAIVLKFCTCKLLDMICKVGSSCTCELFDMDNGVDYDMLS